MTDYFSSRVPTRDTEMAIAQKREALSTRLKTVLIDRLSLQLEVNEISDDSPLFGTGLRLDSVDSLEVAIAVESEFGVTITDEDMQAFRSINTILDFVQERDGV
jgi:acyl carrier protein